jgi:hypothetical protein
VPLAVMSDPAGTIDQAGSSVGSLNSSEMNPPENVAAARLLEAAEAGALPTARAARGPAATERWKERGPTARGATAGRFATRGAAAAERASRWAVGPDCAAGAAAWAVRSCLVGACVSASTAAPQRASVTTHEKILSGDMGPRVAPRPPVSHWTIG